MEEGFSPSDVQQRRSDHLSNEGLVRMRVRFNLGTAFAFPVQFMISSVAESVHLNMPIIIDIIKDEAARHDWDTEISNKPLGNLGMERAILTPHHH